MFAQSTLNIDPKQRRAYPPRHMFYEVILDMGETPNKCTIAPLASRPDFHIVQVKGGQTQLGPLRSPLLLHPDGVCLSEFGRGSPENLGVSSIDCVWRRLDFLLSRVVTPLPQLVKIPSGFETAYPRTSKKNTDPSGGLATIEAIFIAAALLGNWDPTLLSEYYFGRKFVELNRSRFLDLGVAHATDELRLPVFNEKPRHSLQRKLNRGRTTNII